MTTIRPVMHASGLINAIASNFSAHAELMKPVVAGDLLERIADEIRALGRHPQVDVWTPYEVLIGVDPDVVIRTMLGACRSLASQLEERHHLWLSAIYEGGSGDRGSVMLVAETDGPRIAHDEWSGQWLPKLEGNDESDAQGWGIGRLQAIGGSVSMATGPSGTTFRIALPKTDSGHRLPPHTESPTRIAGEAL